MNEVSVILDVGLCAGMIAAPSVLAMAIAWRCLDFPDLGIEAAVPFGAAAASLVLGAGGNPMAALLVGSAAGVVPGLLTGSIHACLGLPKLLAGVLVATLFYSVNLRIMGGANVSLLGKPSFLDVASDPDSSGAGAASFHVGRLIVLALVLGIVTAFLWTMLRTRVGLRLQAVGSNPDFARSVGVPTRAYVVFGLAATNALGAMSGALLAMHQGFADVGMGFGVLVVTVASLAIGERLLSVWGRRSRQFRCVASAVAGAIVYQCLIVAALRFGLPATDLKLATAILVLVFMYAQFRRPAALTAQRGY